jgi:hypothetical protein
MITEFSEESSQKKMNSAKKLRNEGTEQLHISPVPSGFLEESPEAQVW